MKQNFKRFKKLFVTLCLVIGLMPLGTVQVMANENNEHALIFNVSDGKFYEDIDDSYDYNSVEDREYTQQSDKWSFVSSNNTLTLQGFEYTSAKKRGLIITGGALNIYLAEGTENSFVVDIDDGNTNDKIYGVYSNNYDLTIDGTGVLKVKTGESSAETLNRAIYLSYANLTINDGSIEAVSGDCYYSDGIYIYGSLLINGGTIDAHAGNANNIGGRSVGINCAGNNGAITINGGFVSASAGTGNKSFGISRSISDGNNLTVSGGIVTAIGKTNAFGKNSYYTDTDVIANVDEYTYWSNTSTDEPVGNGTRHTSNADDEFDAPFTNDSGNKYVKINTNSYHDITIANTTNGSVSASVYSLPQSEVVNLTITPDEGYETVSVSVYSTDTPSTKVPLSGTGEDQSFTMPDFDVTVSAICNEIPYEELSIAPTSHTFEALTEGYGEPLYDYLDDAKSHTFTVTNTGNVALKDLSLITNSSGIWYDLICELPDELEINDSIEITVTPLEKLSNGSYEDELIIKKAGDTLASSSISLTVLDAEPSIVLGGTNIYKMDKDFSGKGYSWDSANKTLMLTSEYESGSIKFFHCKEESVTLSLDGDVTIDEQESHGICIYSEANLIMDLNNHTLILRTGGDDNPALNIMDIIIRNGTLETYILGSDTAEGIKSINSGYLTVENAKVIAKGDSLNYGGIWANALILKQGAEIFTSGKVGLWLATADVLQFESDEVSLTAVGSEYAIYLDSDLAYPDTTELRNWSNFEAVQPSPVGDGTLLSDIPSEIYSYIPPDTDITLLSNDEIWGEIWESSKYVHIATAAPEVEILGALTIGNSIVSDLEQDASGTNWNWNASEGVLSLNGNIDGDGKINFDASGDIIVTVNSNVDVKQLAYKDGNGGKLTVNGNGKLSIDSEATGIMAGNGLKIADVTIDIATIGSNDYNIKIFDGDLTMDSGSLKLCGNNGVHCDEGNIIISATAEVITSSSVTGYGFYAKKNIEITGGTVNLTSTAADAIFAGGSVSISGDNTQVILNGSQVYPVTYSVTVNKGSGSGEFEEGEFVAIVADEAEAGKSFDRWTIEPDNISFNQGSASTPSSIFIMPAQAVTATAIYTNLASDTYTINILSDGNGIGNANATAATEGSEITLTAVAKSGYQFKEWQVINGNVTIEDNKFTLPAENVTINTVFEVIPVNYTVTFDLNGGTRTGGGELIQTLTSGESAIAPTVTRSNYTFKGWDEDFSNVNSNVTITATWSYKASSSGGTSSPEESEQTESSSVTVTASMASTTVIGATNSDGKISAHITQSQMDNAIEAAGEASNKNGEAPRVQIQVESSSGDDIETTLPIESVNNLVTGEVESLSISSKAGNMQFDAQAIASINNQASEDLSFSVSKVGISGLSDAALDVVGDRPVYQLSVTSGDKIISEFDGYVTVSLPYVLAEGEDKNAIVAYYINKDGEPELMQNCYYDEETGTLIFKTTHFSKYAVAYNKVSFDDVSDDEWYSEAINYLASREITKGTSKNTFSPNNTLKRGDFITLLLRAYYIEMDEKVQNNFSDAGDTYYTSYLGIAKALGISEGVGENKFAPEKAITRQEMFTLLYKTLKTIKQLPEGDSGKTILDFTDRESIATYAKESMEYLVKNGVVRGNEQMLLPRETTTRGQMAQVLYNLNSFK